MASPVALPVVTNPKGSFAKKSIPTAVTVSATGVPSFTLPVHSPLPSYDITSVPVICLAIMLTGPSAVDPTKVLSVTVNPTTTALGSTGGMPVCPPPCGTDDD